MKKFKTRDLILILIIVLFAAALLAVGLKSRKSSAAGPISETASAASAGTEASEGEGSETASGTSDSAASLIAQEQAKAYMAEYPAESYLIVTTGNGTHTPIPLDQDAAFRITFDDGEENVVHIGVNSFYVESSTCDNQNCVDEGEVTLENMNSRALYNMVVCLPHNLMLELVEPDEAQARLTEMLTLAEESTDEATPAPAQ